MNIIGHHLWDINNNPEWRHGVNEVIVQPHILILKSMKKIIVMDTTWTKFSSIHIPFKIVAIKKKKRPTRRIFQPQANWDEWKQ